MYGALQRIMADDLNHIIPGNDSEGYQLQLLIRAVAWAITEHKPADEIFKSLVRMRNAVTEESGEQRQEKEQKEVRNES